MSDREMNADKNINTTNQNDWALELHAVEYADAGQTHIYPTDLQLRAGEFTNLLGATLAGKTTLMRLMAGLESPSGGVLTMRGENVTGRSPRERDIAMVYQQFVNYPTMNVFDNIAAPLRTRGKPPPDLTARVGEVAELLHISDLLQRMPAELSGGQQQRIALARALVRHAELVLLDEPLANLDYKLREQLREELPRLFAERGSAIVYATTEPDEALLMGGRTAALVEGRVAQFGDSADVYHNPRTLAAARIFSSPPLNEIAVKSDEHAKRALGAEKFAAAVPHGTIAFRPHHLKLGVPPDDFHLNLRGEVVLTEIFGSESFIHLRTDNAYWVSRTHAVVAPADGETIDMHVAHDDLLLFSQAGERAEVG